jgi:excisionase family DNA binding protein
MEKILTVKEVAQKLNVCQRTVIRHIKQKKLRASKMGHWRIKESDIEKFFNANTNTR